MGSSMDGARLPIENATRRRGRRPHLLAAATVLCQLRAGQLIEDHEEEDEDDD